MNEIVKRHEENFIKTGGGNGSWDSIYDLKDGTKFEIDTRKDSWCEVDYSIFRSWGGKRRINGKEYNGVVYYLLSLKESI